MDWFHYSYQRIVMRWDFECLYWKQSEYETDPGYEIADTDRGIYINKRI